VKNKMEKGDGMSFAEFSYPLLQAWDWWHMYHTKGVSMQIGGSDQFGNITAGIDAIKYISANHPNPTVREETKDVPLGFTVPLLTTSSGAKFGKSAGNAIWLDREQTSPFDLYGYFLRTSDADVGKYLKLFTFMPIEKIDELVKEHMESPSQRKAQHALAREFLELVHGVDEAKHAESQHRLIFQGKAVPLFSPEVAAAQNGTAAQINLNNRPKANLTLPQSLIYTKSIGRILFACGLATSASEGHRLANNQAVYIGGPPGGTKKPMDDGALSFTPVKVWFPEDTKKFLIDNELLILRRGKHNVRIIRVVPDEEYAASRLTFPGQQEGWKPQNQEVLDGISKDYEVVSTREEMAADTRDQRKEQWTLWSPESKREEGWAHKSQEEPDYKSAEIAERKLLLKQDIEAARVEIKMQTKAARAARVAQLKADAAVLGPTDIDRIWHKRIEDLNKVVNQDFERGALPSKREVAGERRNRAREKRQRKVAKFQDDEVDSQETGP
jgi:tyrosyl-tRNA synthetase